MGNRNGALLKDIMIYPSFIKPKCVITHNNFIKTYRNPHVLDPKSYMPNIKTIPRTPDVEYIPAGMFRGRTPWTWGISLFKEYKGAKGDSKAVLKRCFESDWKQTNIPRVLKNNEEDVAAVKELLWEIYPRFKDCYREFSAKNPSTSNRFWVWGLGQ